MTDNNESKIELVTTEQQKKSDEVVSKRAGSSVVMEQEPRFWFFNAIKRTTPKFSLTASEFNCRVSAARENEIPFTYMEELTGETVAKLYLDYDGKLDYRPSEEEAAKLKATHREAFEKIIEKILAYTKIDRGLLQVHYGNRHGELVIDKKNKSSLYKVSYRAFVMGMKMRVRDMPMLIRRALGLEAKEMHPVLDLSVYKGKEQLLGVMWGRKDLKIDPKQRQLVPDDPTIAASEFLASNVSKSDIEYKLPASDASFFAKGGKGKGKATDGVPKETKKSVTTRRNKAAQPRAVEEDVKEVDISDHSAAVLTDINNVREKLGIKEFITSVKERPDLECYNFPLKSDFCAIAGREHGSNHRYLCLTRWGLTYKCFNAECKVNDDPVWKIPMKDLPLALRELFSTLTKANIQSLSYTTDTVLQEKMAESLRGTTMKVAKVAHHLLGDRIVCENRKQWYTFEQHTWEHHTMAPDDVVVDVLEAEYKKILLWLSKVAPGGLGEEEQQVLKKLIYNVNVVIDKINSSQWRQGMLSDLAVLQPKKLSMDNLPDLFAFNNGVYDLGTGTMRDGNPGDYLSKKAPFEYHKWEDHPEERRKIIEGFMEDIQPDPDTRHLLRKILASGLAGRNTDNFFILLIGIGANGKGTLLKLLERALGPYACAVTAALLCRQSGGAKEANEALLSTKGMRTGICEDCSEDKIAAGALFKVLSGGDTVAGRGNYDKQTKWQNQMVTFIPANKMFKIEDKSKATWRRILPLDFPVEFVVNPKGPFQRPLIDNYEEQVLLPCADVFLSYLIHWYPAYLSEGIKQNQWPDAVWKTYNSQRASQDGVMGFIQTYCNFGDKEATVLRTDVVKQYMQYCENTETVEVIAKLDAELDKLCPRPSGKKIERPDQRVVTTAEGKGIKGWKGITVTPVPIPEKPAEETKEKSKRGEVVADPF